MFRRDRFTYNHIEREFYVRKDAADPERALRAKAADFAATRGYKCIEPVRKLTEY